MGRSVGKTKLVAMYLPQYHETVENNKFWGKGFTDWVSVRKAEPLFHGHEQPREPLGDNYYDLSETAVLRWQAQLAKRYGIYGFCFYHYWFDNNKTVLDAPVKNLLAEPDIGLPFCFAWDNTSWVRSWSKFSGNAWAPKYDRGSVDEEGREYLLKLDYGGEKEWRLHFEYLLPFFKDPRYMKKDGKPIFLFFSTGGIHKLKEIERYWRGLAEENGFPGMYLIARCDPVIRKKLMDSEFIYQPISSGWQKRQVFNKYICKYLKINLRATRPALYDYDAVWNKILKNAGRCARKNILLGGFVNYDDTPRRGADGKVVCGGSPEKFRFYLKQLLRISSRHNKEYLFLTAWNEWGEGAYLEPDKKYGYQYLEAVRSVLLEEENEEK